MTVVDKASGGGAAQGPEDAKAELAKRDDLITLSIDDVEVSVPKGTLAIRAAELIGVAIPRFCDHPLLDPVGACRQCLVEVPDMGNGRAMPKPQVSCTLEVAPGMKIKTQVTSPVADKAQHGMMEFLLMNHPLDCPVCDKGGECPLQNQAMTNGRGESRYEGVKRTFPKPVNISAQVLLDRDRCILCARCTRFSEQIAGDPFIALVERGALQQVGIYEPEPFESYFSGNTIQICPVGALTSAAYRFRSRPYDLVSTPTACEHCASGCELRADHRRNVVMRRLAGNDPEVNEEWNCDKGRFAFVSGRGKDRLTVPLVRSEGALRPASWAEAIDAAVQGLRAAGSTGVLTGGRLTAENAYAYSRFARTVLGTNDIDFRSRPLSPEETDFLAADVAGIRQVSYSDLETASSVLCVALEPEEESPILFLRLRKANAKSKLRTFQMAPFLTAGARKMGAKLIATAPGDEAHELRNLGLGVQDAAPTFDAGSIILIGERAAMMPGSFAAAQDLATRTGARLAWVPRRAGDRGAIEVGCMPNLLPGGRPVSDPAARVDTQAVWGVDGLPATPGRDSEQMLVAAAEDRLGALVVAGVEPADFADPAMVTDALEATGFLVSLETRLSEVTERADVVFPVALNEEHEGTFVNWEGRPRQFEAVITTEHPMTDLRILAALADAMGTDLGIRTPAQARAELAEFDAWQGVRPEPSVSAGAVAEVQGNTMRLSTWRQLIDASRGNDGEKELLATRPRVVARVSAGTAAALGLREGGFVTVGNHRGSLEFPVEIQPGMVDNVVWVPTNAPGLSLRTALAAVNGDEVELAPVGTDSELVASSSTGPPSVKQTTGGGQ